MGNTWDQCNKRNYVQFIKHVNSIIIEKKNEIHNNQSNKMHDIHKIIAIVKDNTKCEVLKKQ